MRSRRGERRRETTTKESDNLWSHSCEERGEGKGRYFADSLLQTTLEDWRPNNVSCLPGFFGWRFLSRLGESFSRLPPLHEVVLGCLGGVLDTREMANLILSLPIKSCHLNSLPFATLLSSQVKDGAKL